METQELQIAGDGNFETKNFSEELEQFVQAFNQTKSQHPKRYSDNSSQFRLFAHVWNHSKFYRIFATWPFVPYNLQFRMMDLTGVLLDEMDSVLDIFDDGGHCDDLRHRVYVLFFLLHSLYFAQPRVPSNTPMKEAPLKPLLITRERMNRIQNWFVAHKDRCEPLVVAPCWYRLRKEGALQICARQLPFGFWTFSWMQEIRGEIAKPLQLDQPRSFVTKYIRESLAKLEAIDRQLDTIAQNLSSK